jgi:hypothetical protein
LKNKQTGEDLYPELFGRADLREILTAVMSIAFRECTGNPDHLMMACSDDIRGCLLFRATMRGDVEAMALLAKVPRLRIRMARQRIGRASRPRILPKRCRSFSAGRVR